MERRKFLLFLAAIPSSLWAGSLLKFFNSKKIRGTSMITKLIPIGLHWPTQEPFLFCAHHLDHYPKGNGVLAPDVAHLKGRDIGQDFEEKDGFRMYHGDIVPGFPVHPHRGFETITLVRRGYADHADSLGSAGRYGEGDVQWMTAGSGLQHSEMFPLLHEDKENTLELFQIWLNLPKKNKMVDPDFKMLWSNQIPKINPNPDVELTLISGEYGDHKFYQAPKNSWANSPENNVNIFLIKMKANAKLKIDAAKIITNRTLYLFSGKEISINGEIVQGKNAILLESKGDLLIESGSSEVELLFLEAKPIGEPVAKYGPFVMNTQIEIMQAISDYQKTEFGGWQWDKRDMVHGNKIERFAKYPDGRIEKP